MRRKRTRTLKFGRPPAGVRDGEKVKDYPQVTMRVPPDTRTKLAALSELQQQPQWRIVLDALETYSRQLAPGDRRRLRAIIER
jgi:hypothetical protein